MKGEVLWEAKAGGCGCWQSMRFGSLGRASWEENVFLCGMGTKKEWALGEFGGSSVNSKQRRIKARRVFMKKWPMRLELTWRIERGNTLAKANQVL